MTKRMHGTFTKYKKNIYRSPFVCYPLWAFYESVRDTGADVLSAVGETEILPRRTKTATLSSVLLMFASCLRKVNTPTNTEIKG